MTNKSRRKSQRMNKLREELILGRTWSDDKRCVYHCANKTGSIPSVLPNDSDPD